MIRSGDLDARHTCRDVAAAFFSVRVMQGVEDDDGGPVARWVARLSRLVSSAPPFTSTSTSKASVYGICSVSILAEEL